MSGPDAPYNNTKANIAPMVHRGDRESNSSHNGFIRSETMCLSEARSSGQESLNKFELSGCY